MTEQPINDDGFTEDQLWQRLEGQIGSERASTLIDLGFFAFQREDHEQALALADAAIEAANDSENEQISAQAFRSRGVVLRNLGRYTEAAAAHKDAAAILERFDSLRDLADVYMHVSWNLESAEIYDQALLFAEHAQRVATECEAASTLGMAHWQIADLLPKLNREDEVFEHLSLCRQAWRQAENINGVLDVDDRMADRFISDGDYKAAVGLLSDCLDVASSLKDQPDRGPYFAYALARALRFDGQAERAQQVLQQPLQFNLEQQKMRRLGYTYKELAACAADLEQMDEAFSLIAKARAHFDVVGANDALLDCDQMRAVWLHGEGRFDEATEVNASMEMRSDGLRSYWARSRRVDNLRVAGQFDDAWQLLEADENGAAPAESAAWFWRQAIKVRVLDALGRAGDAQNLALEVLEADTSEASNGTKAVMFEFRGNAFVGLEEQTARADWAHAVALYLAAGMHGEATQLSARFLPGNGGIDEMN